MKWKHGRGWLTLSRQKGEIITIGDDIEIIVADIRGDKVRLGIRAPKDVPVNRLEVAERIAAEDRMAAVKRGGENPPAPVHERPKPPPPPPPAKEWICACGHPNKHEPPRCTRCRRVQGERLVQVHVL